MSNKYESSRNFLIIKGAKEHNLKNITLSIPKNKFIVITGISGSGKSTLAFDTIYAEGQRRYIESLSTYARQFLGQMQKPDVESIEGLSPSIAIEQRSGSKNPRSTVGTITEIYDYLRLLYGRIGKQYCYNCGREISTQTIDQIVDSVLEIGEGKAIYILSPIARNKKGTFKHTLRELQKEGYIRVRIDGEVQLIEEIEELDKNKKHNIDVVVDRLRIRKENKSRIATSIEQAIQLSDGNVIIKTEDTEKLFSTKNHCFYCGISYPEITPTLFSFNSPYGACPKCTGIGYAMKLNAQYLLDLPKNTPISKVLWAIQQIIPSYKITHIISYFKSIGKKFWGELTKEDKNFILYGDKSIKGPHYYISFDGLINIVNNARISLEGLENIEKEYVSYKALFIETKCDECGGKRLRKEALAVKISGISISEFTEFTIEKAYNVINNLRLTETETKIVEQVIKEIRSRLKFLMDVGLSYLTLDRMTGTLSGGELQRIRLATQIGSRLTGVLYVLDEPTIGLHPRDNERLINTLKELRDIGNTIIVVEHDEETIKSADYIVELGPLAGKYGGEVIFSGYQSEFQKANTLTAKYIRREKQIPIPKIQKEISKFIILKDLHKHNLKHIDVKIPLNMFVCITGVSGSGKSTLLNDILYYALKNVIHNTNYLIDGYGGIEGDIDAISDVSIIDQSPIGRTPRSNPATYTNIFTHIRELFANTREAKMRGYTPSRFSFNVKGGRCEACKGAGYKLIEMHFLPDVYIVCDICKGKRYNRETLNIKYKGKTISDVLDMTIDEAYDFFENIPVLRRKLGILKEVGLGYLELGQPATTLSGGEAQRIKLSKELSKVRQKGTVYLLDEPTTGLHFEDIKNLLKILRALVEKENTVIVIEHNLDVIKTADWIIDLGPEGGERGGYIVAEGPPKMIAQNPKSYTGKYLQQVLQ